MKNIDSHTVNTSQACMVSRNTVQLPIGNYIISVTNTNRSAKIKNHSFSNMATGNNNQSDMLNVYPNPANNKLIVEYAIVSGFEAGCTIGLYDMQGNLIKSIPVDKQLNVKEMDVSGIANGNYILSICKFGNKDYSKQISIVH